MENLQAKIGEPAGVVAEEVFQRSGLEADLAKQATGENEAIENVEELISAAADFMQMNPEGTVAEWLQQISLVSDVDAVQSDSGSVTLMTLHAAKGLEFHHVYIIGLEDRLLPHERYMDDPAQLEEERRLCFVGITRAMKQLTLTHARWRAHRGMVARTTESQFLSELPQDEVEWHREEATQSSGAHRGPERQGKGDYSTWKNGMYLRHPSFGVGRLVWQQPSGGFTRAIVRFPAYGEKTLILEYAKMTPLEIDECQL